VSLLAPSRDEEGSIMRHRVLSGSPSWIATLAVSLLPGAALAAPPIWESDFGDAIESLTGCDDCTESVELSFSFPFDGEEYTTVFVGTNGGIQLGSLGADGDIDYDHWEYLEEFLSDEAPSVAAFNSDLDLTTTGTIHFNDLGDRAVFTWNEVGTNQNETALLRFQIILHADGRIVLGYNGILDDPEEDLLEDLDEGIVVGITAGDVPALTDPGTFDLSGGPFTAGTTIHERWCYDEADSCGFEGGDSEGLSGPINTAFDLDQRNVVFTPTDGGFTVPEPGAALLQVGALLAVAGLSARRRRNRRVSR
jgi:hypothetical protein